MKSSKTNRIKMYELEDVYKRQPFSLVLACANLQDKYDLLHFFRDNLIANSGTTGDWLDLSVLPTALGLSLIHI